MYFLAWNKIEAHKTVSRIALPPSRVFVFIIQEDNPYDSASENSVSFRRLVRENSVDEFGAEFPDPRQGIVSLNDEALYLPGSWTSACGLSSKHVS
jgi:hypothetical protein